MNSYYKTDRGSLYNGDCLEGMKEIPDKSIDMILCDLPYGTTACKWDKIINSELLWEQYERIIKDNAVIVLFASGQFVQKIINSNEKLYKYKWIWLKNKKGNFMNSKNRPLTSFEEILVFSKGNTANGSLTKMKYYPQGIQPIYKSIKNNATKFGTVVGKRPSHKEINIQEFTNYPCDTLSFKIVEKGLHPTQKPIELIEYLIKTYTNEGETVLDNCIGSGTTAIASLRTGRFLLGLN